MRLEDRTGAWTATTLLDLQPSSPSSRFSHRSTMSSPLGTNFETLQLHAG